MATYYPRCPACQHPWARHRGISMTRVIFRHRFAERIRLACNECLCYDELLPAPPARFAGDDMRKPI